MTAKRFTIKHDIPGRLRLHLPEAGAAAPSDAGLEALQNSRGIRFIRTNPKCASLIVRYDPETITRDHVLLRVCELFASGRAMLDKRAADNKTSCVAQSPCACSGDHHESTGTAMRRFAIVSALAGGVFIRTTLLGAAVAQTIASPLGIAVMACSLPIARKGISSLVRGKPTIDSFLAGGVIASVFGGQAITALEILWINSGADLLSAWIAERSRKHISEILEITSHHTFVLVDGVEVEREVASLRPGDVVVLHSGEKVAVDGTIVHGEALLDEAPITGRPDSVHKREGDVVFAGTFVREGIIRVTTERAGDATYLARIMHKVQDSLETRASIEGVADRLASRLVKLGFFATAGTFLLTGSLWRAYTVLLVMACPCATVLAASTAVSAAISAAARNHILIKGGRYLEEAGACKVIFFDKTGTLTTTEPQLARTAIANGSDTASLLQLAASAETHNHHPLAQAIMAAAKDRGITPIPHEECDYHMGMGMRAVIKEDEILVGNAKLARQYDAPITNAEGLANEAKAFQNQGLTVLYVFRNRTLEGILGFEPQLRPEATAVLEQLRKLGVKRIAMITGDEDASARQLAWRLGLDACHASAMPEEKSDIIIETSQTHGPVLMVGDGINDALALTKADVGVAFGTSGSEVAIEAADIALVKDDLQGLVAVYALSRKTLRVAHENFWIATGSNIVGVLLGAMGLLSPVTAGVVHIAHSLGVLANSSRLLHLPQTTSKESTGTGASNGFQNAIETTEISCDQTPCARQDQNQV